MSEIWTRAEHWQAMRDACPHYDKVLVEGGYERTWSLNEREGNIPVAVFHGLEDFSDDGDGEYVVRCSSCLKEFDLPEDWDWG
jgi:hypothetical protein